MTKLDFTILLLRAAIAETFPILRMSLGSIL